MNTSHGWIKLYRCLLDDAVCQKSAYFHLWVTLLLMANHKEHEFIFNNEIHKVTPGQLITGRKKLSKLTKIPEATIGRMLKCLESGRKIEQKTFKRFRIITIINWSSYQSEHPSDSASGHEPAPNRPSPDHHVSTYKNEKNVKKEEEYIYTSFFFFIGTKGPAAHPPGQRRSHPSLDGRTVITKARPVPP